MTAPKGTTSMRATSAARDATIKGQLAAGLSRQEIAATLPPMSRQLLRSTFDRLAGKPTRGKRRPVEAATPAPVANGGHMLPVYGDRDETCARYGDCLDAHLRARAKNSDERPASCPVACPHREAAPRLRATAYASTNGAARGAT